MKKLKKIYITTIALAVLILASSTVSAGLFDNLIGDDSNNQANPLDDKTQFKVYATSPNSVEGELQFISSDKEFYDNEETQEWFACLDGYVILDTGDDYLVVNRSETNQLPTFDDDFDNVHYNIIRCKVLETHPLGTGLVDYLLVSDIELVGNDTVSYDELYNSTD